MRIPGSCRFLFPVLMGLTLLGQSNRIQAQSAGSSALPPAPHVKEVRMKHVLVIGQTKDWEHDSVSATMAAIYNMGKESGLWDTTMRTDTKLLTKKDLPRNAKNLNYFDLHRLCQHQRRTGYGRKPEADMMSFIKEDGKGFVGIHAALDTNHTLAGVRRDARRLVRRTSLDDLQCADHQ